MTEYDFVIKRMIYPQHPAHLIALHLQEWWQRIRRREHVYAR